MKKRKIFSLFLMMVIIMTSVGSFAIDEKNLQTRSKAYLLGDSNTGEIILAHNTEEVLEIASITKLMTYMVTMDQVKKNNVSLEDRIIVDEDIVKIKGSSLKLEIEDNYSLKELIEGSLIVSANDATYAIARYVGGTVENFVSLMNKKAEEIGLETAIFLNPTGLPVANSELQNRMSTEDLFKMSRYLLENYPEVLNYTKTPFLEIEAKNFKESNSNALVGKVQGVDGLKTGFTNKAGYCLVSTGVREKELETDLETRLISVVMGTSGYEERVAVSTELLSYGLENYRLTKILDKRLPVDTISFENAKKQSTEVFTDKELIVLKNDADDIDIRVRVNDGMKFPYKEGQAVGKVIVDKNGQNIYEGEVYVKEKIKKAGFLRRFFRKIMGIFS